MTTKQYLEQIDRWNKTINNKLSEIWQLRQLATNIGIAYQEDNVQTFGDKDTLGSAVSKIVDKENEINELIDSFLKAKDIIIKQIESLGEGMVYQVLFSRYVEMKTFDDIAKENNYSIRQIMRIYKNALHEFELQYLNFYINM